MGAGRTDPPRFVSDDGYDAPERYKPGKNRFKGMSQDQLIYEAMMNNYGPDESAAWEEAYAPYETAMKVQNVAGLADLGVSGLGMAGGVAKQAKPVAAMLAKSPVKNVIPGLGSALGVTQGVAQNLSGVNPYGEGKPSNWQIFNDAVESSAGFAGPFAIPVQLLLGGILSDAANFINMTEEDKRNASMLSSGNWKDLEQKVLYSSPRDWDRNKFSQIFSGRLNEAEGIRRASWTQSYAGITDPKERLAALTKELAERKEWDETMADTDFIQKSLYALGTIGKTDRQLGESSRAFVESQRKQREMRRRWRDDPMSVMIY